MEPESHSPTLRGVILFGMRASTPAGRMIPLAQEGDEAHQEGEEGEEDDTPCPFSVSSREVVHLERVLCSSTSCLLACLGFFLVHWKESERKSERESE